MPARQDISEWDSDSESRLAGRPSAVGKAGETKTPLSDRRELPRFSIVVLPFVNIGGDSEQGYFADGVTDSLTTDLSRIRGAFVIGSRTAFTHKGKAADVRQIGRDLNVCYALQGSVQRSANCMRINVQLVDAETGNHLWAERFEKPVADLFDMQDEIVSRLAGALNTELIAAEVRRAEKASNPDSMDLYFQGLAWFNKGVTRRMWRKHAASSIARSPSIPTMSRRLLDRLADVREGAHSFVAAPMAAVAVAEVKLIKALSSVPDHARGHMMLGFVYIFSKRGAQGIAECEHAIALDRNLAAAHSAIGLGSIFIGRAEETEAHVGEALRLSPRDTLAYIWMTFVGVAKLYLGS
jgi:TolB-like protein